MAQDVNIKINVDSSSGVAASKSMKQQLKELREQMVELEVSTNGLSKATAEQKAKYAELQAQAGQIADAIGDVQQRINASADDYQNFNAVMEGGKGIIAAAQGIEGLTSLFGINNQAVEESIKVMASLQSVMNSVNTVQQIFNKDSKVRVALQKLLSAETKKTAVADGEAAVASGALAAGEGVATGASFTLVGALKAVSAAIKSIPVIGWILAAVSALATLIGFIASANDESEEGLALQEAASENLERQKAKYEAVDAKIIEIRDDLNTWNNILETADKKSTIYKETLKKLGDELGVDLENQKIDTKTLNELEGIHIKLKEAQLKQEFDQNQYLADRNKLQQINNVLSAAASLDVKERKQFIQDELGLSEKAAADYAAAIHDGMDNHTTWMKALADGNTATAASYQRLNDSVDGYSAKAAENAKKVTDLTNEQDKIIEQSGLKRKGTAEKVSKSTAKNTTKTNENTTAILNNIDAIEKQKTILDDIASLRRQINDEVYKDDEKTYEGRKKHYAEEMRLAEEAFNQEVEDMKISMGLMSDEEAEQNEEFQTWLDLRETAHSQYLENISELNDKNEQEEKERLQRIDDEEELSRKEKEDKEKEHQERLKELKISATQEAFSGIQSIMDSALSAELDMAEGNEKKQKQIRQKYAIANLVVNAAESAAALAVSIPKTLAAYSEIPFAGPVLAAIQIAATTASIIAQITNIKKQKAEIMRAAKGGFIVGPSHSDGGVMIEAEGGEMILNKNVGKIPQFRALASAMNTATGGVSFPSIGGEIIPNNDLMVESIVKQTIAGVTQIPVFVTESNISQVSRRVNTIENLKSI